MTFRICNLFRLACCLQFFEAAAVEGHAQAPAFAALGRYFAEVGGRMVR